MRAAPLILVTRPDGERDPLVAALRVAGYAVAAIPTVGTRPVAAGGALDDAVRRLDAWDWIAVTSRAGVRGLADAADRAGLRLGYGSEAAHDSGAARGSEAAHRPEAAHDSEAALGFEAPRGPNRPRWAAVGPATAAALDAVGIRADLVPAETSSHGIAQAFGSTGQLDGARVLLARADAAGSDLPAALRSLGAVVDEVVAYHTVEGPPEAVDELSAVLEGAGPAAAVVASGSAARGLVAMAAATGRSPEAVRSLPVIAIGPSTATVARSLGFERVHQAAEASVSGLVAAVTRIVPLPSAVAAAPSELNAVEVPS